MNRILKKITWDDEWENYVRFGVPKEPLLFDKYGNSIKHELPEPYTFAIIEVMAQLKGKMTVYSAYLKGVEAVFGMSTYNQCGACLQWIIKLKKKEIKNLKKGIFDEELADFLSVATKGYRRWYESNNKENLRTKSE